MNIDHEVKLDFDDVLLVPQRSRAASRKQVQLKRNFKFYHSDKEWGGVPVMAANMDTTGTFAMGRSLSRHSMVTCIHKHYSLEEYLKGFAPATDHVLSPDRVWYSLGIKDRDLQKLIDFVHQANFVPNICVDAANGYTDNFVEFCSEVRRKFNRLDSQHSPIIMAGNVCSPEMVQELILHGGVDMVKIGIGPGSACTTRLKTGCGYPQLSCISECAYAAHGLRADSGRLGLICADGGCRYPGDVAKAFAAGADFVMLGGMLAGSDECEGEWEYHGDGSKENLCFYGMSSQKAQEKHGDGLLDYRSSEGRVVKTPYRGPVNDVIQDILGGVRSACAYTGAICLKDFSKTARFVRVNRTHNNQSV
jgi:GMP reductase